MGDSEETKVQTRGGAYYYGISKHTGRPLIQSYKAPAPIRKPIWARSVFIIAFWIVVFISCMVVVSVTLRGTEGAF